MKEERLAEIRRKGNLPVIHMAARDAIRRLRRNGQDVNQQSVLAAARQHLMHWRPDIPGGQIEEAVAEVMATAAAAGVTLPASRPAG